MGIPSSTSITRFKRNIRLPPRINFLFFKSKNVYSNRFHFSHVETFSFLIFERFRLTKTQQKIGKHADKTSQSSIAASCTEKFLF